MASYLTPDQSPTRVEVDAWPGPVVLEFGTAWCGYCRAFAPVLESLLHDRPEIHHVKIEDGSGRALGRSFRVTLWPTLVFLFDGQVQHVVARPDRQQAREGLEKLATEVDGGS